MALDLIEKTGRTIKAIEWRISPDARKAREELFAVRGALTSSNIDALPKILTFSVGGKEYTSVRRIQGSGLLRKDDEASNPDDRETVFELNPNQMPDGSVSVLVEPYVRECLNEEIADRFPYGGYTFMCAIGDGVVYDAKDWEIGLEETSFVKRVGNKFYKIPSAGFFSMKNEDFFDKQHFPQELKVNRFGKVEIDTESGYGSQAEIDLRRGWHSKSATLYVLIEGTSESQKVRRELKTSVLVPIRQTT